MISITCHFEFKLKKIDDPESPVAVLCLWTDTKFEGPVNKGVLSNVKRVSRRYGWALQIKRGEFVMVNVERKNSGSVFLLNLYGPIVIGETETLSDVVQTLPPTSSVILDLSHVTMVDAHGLGALLQLREQAHARDMRFELMNLSKSLREVLRITRLDSVFQIRSGVEFLPLPANARRTALAA